MVVNFAGYKVVWISENNIIGSSINVSVFYYCDTVECFLSSWIGGLPPPPDCTKLYRDELLIQFLAVIFYISKSKKPSTGRR